MNKYQRAMFQAYWLPVLIFFVFPSVVIGFIGFSVGESVITWVRQSVTFLIVLFFVGMVLAPIVGPRLSVTKTLSFVMSFICMFSALAAYTLGMMLPDFSGANIGFIVFISMAVLGIFPALIGGYFFIGTCTDAE